jgi:hypothetical protein
VIFQCYEGYAMLILDLPCSLGTVAGQSLADFSQSQAKIKIVFSKLT